MVTYNALANIELGSRAAAGANVTHTYYAHLASDGFINITRNPSAKYYPGCAPKDDQWGEPLEVHDSAFTSVRISLPELMGGLPDEIHRDVVASIWNEMGIELYDACRTAYPHRQILHHETGKPV